MSKQSKSTTENKPPAWAQPLFEQSASEAQRLYNSGSGGNTYMGSTVSPLSQMTMQGVNQLGQAGQAWDTAGTRGLFGQLGAESVSDPYVGQLTNLANDNSGFRGILDSARDPSAAQQYLTDTASGSYLTGEGNPFYRDRLEREIADSNALLRSQFSGMGRSGSGVSQSVIADNTRDMLMGGLENDWNRERGLQMQAVGMLDSARQGNLAAQIAAATGQGNMLSQAGALRGAGLDRAMGATGAMAGLDQQNFQNRLAGAGATLQAGGILDQQSQRELADEVARWYALDNQDWTRLGMLQSAAAGAAGNYGVQNQTTRQPINPWGAIGAMFSGKGGSDIRIKEKIAAVGKANGITIYEWNYKGQKERWRGVMAQELPLGSPALIVEPNGYLAVDYHRLGMMMEAA